MRFVIPLLIGLCPPAASAATVTESVAVTGAGSTFVYPLMAKWAARYRAVTGDVVNYQSIGSGGGIKQIENATVDFGATDMPLEPAELARHGLVQLPLVAGAVLPVVHLGGVRSGELRLTGAALAEVYLGRVTRWNDPRLRALNPDLPLPDRLITVVHRADGSGTSYVFTGYLSAASATWRDRVGRASAVTWPAGIGGKGNEGVASFVKQIDGAVGYVETAFAARARLVAARLDRPDGAFVAPGAPDWPLVGRTYLLFRRADRGRPAARAARAFVRWALEHGDEAARELHYEPLDDEARARALATLAAGDAA